MKSKILTSAMFIILFSGFFVVNVKAVEDGFYGFPSSLEIEEGTSKVIKGEFYHNIKAGLKDVCFTIIGIERSWYDIEPENIDLIPANRYTPITITLSIPQDTSGYFYDLILGATCSNVEIENEQEINIKIIDVTTTTTTSTSITTTIIEENVTEEETPTGAFTLPPELTKYWYVIIIVIVVIITGWGFYTRREEFGYEEPREYVAMQPRKKEVRELPKPEVEKVETIRTKISPRDRLEISRRKMIDEIRRKAREMDKDTRR